MARVLVVAVAVIGLAGVAVAQKPHAQAHHAKAAEHKVAPVALPKAGGGANSADVQLKRLEQQTAKTNAANPQKQKQKAAVVKYKPEAVGGKKNPPIDFKGNHPKAKQGGKPGVPKNALHARH
jgi:hypothetical protein